MKKNIKEERKNRNRENKYNDLKASLENNK